MTLPGTPPTKFFASEPLTVGIIGLGYVGLPLLVTAAAKGLSTIGYDIASDRVRRLESGISHIDDVTDDALQGAIDTGTQFTDDPTDLGAADAIIICVPSPLGRNRQPDLSYIEAAAETVQKVAHAGQLVSLESTTYPGTTEDYIVPAVEGAGLTIDEDVWVAFSPERVSPGDAMKTRDIPKVVGGVTPDSTAVAVALYRRLVPSVHAVSSARAAEMTKLVENTYRAVNIGLINEMAQLAETLDIDIWEVVEAAATKPFGFQAFWPGPGVGGHCIPLDPQFLAWRAREANFATRFIDLAEQVNSKMPAYNAGRIASLLNEAGRPVFGTDILAVGIAYKPNVADDRESAALEVLQELTRSGASVSVLDQLVGADRIRAHGYQSVEADGDLSRFAVAVILTDHDDVDYAAIADEVPLVYDARGVYRRLAIARDNVHPL